MEKTLLFLTAASALGAVCILAEREYHLISMMQNWTSAQSYCREHFTDLATVGNMEDMQDLNMEVSSNSQNKLKYLWLGLYNDLTSWRWSMSEPEFYGNGEADFRNWLSGQPDNSGLSDCCTMMSATGGWNDVSCKQSMAAICFDISGLSVNFVYTEKSMTWSEAQIYCREHYSDLASVRNKEDNKEITLLIPDGKNVWIGLFRDSWKWSDGSSFSFQSWSRNEPNGAVQTCGAAFQEDPGSWFDALCNDKFSFICYKRKFSLKKVALRFRVSSLLDLSDLTVQEAIRSQLKQKLDEQQVIAEIKLSWGKPSDGKIFHKDAEEMKKLDKPYILTVYGTIFR